MHINLLLSLNQSKFEWASDFYFASPSLRRSKEDNNKNNAQFSILTVDIFLGANHCFSLEGNIQHRLFFWDKPKRILKTLEQEMPSLAAEDVKECMSAVSVTRDYSLVIWATFTVLIIIYQMSHLFSLVQDILSNWFLICPIPLTYSPGHWPLRQETIQDAPL